MTEKEAAYEPAPIHLLMRFSDKMGRISDTIEAHAAVLKKKGAVWYGKMGKTLGEEKIQRINTQTKTKAPTFLYLIQKSANKGYQVYRGRIEEIARSLPNGQRDYVPSYYDVNGLRRYIRLWTKLSSLRTVPSLEITKYVVSSSGSPALVSIAGSMAALFVIRDKDAQDRPQRDAQRRLSLEDDNDPDWDF